MKPSIILLILVVILYIPLVIWGLIKKVIWRLNSYTFGYQMYSEVKDGKKEKEIN